MIQGIAFQTRARTVDHLGREQIADCPTAISELWKNAFDAYARTVELNIYAGTEPVAAMVDDGHGMSREEFEKRWLVVGTESKAARHGTTLADRNGLKLRPRQGQKGIGRLSCANLGPLLLLVSKRSDNPFVAALMDWRLFENPFLNLSDIRMPVIEFDRPERLFDLLPDLAESLSSNVSGEDDSGRSHRIRAAWADVERETDSDGHNAALSAEDILTDIEHLCFVPEHLARWPVWTHASDRGTALLISGLNYDLRVHADRSIADSAAEASRKRLFETLSSFVDPFVDPADPAAEDESPDFHYAVRVWSDGSPREIVGSEKQFTRREVDGMEHRIEGQVDENGVFMGNVRAFGEMLPDLCVIHPPTDLRIPDRSNSRVGPFDIYIASMEFILENTTHPRAEYDRYRDLAGEYSGFMVFRDGLRVLPYGRTDNDFFEIEFRRSKSVGREFWNHRQLFGRIAIGRERNPNLKDKAGREGLLDNHAAKVFKDLVSNVLMQSARLYFGSDSDYRKDLLPEIRKDNRRERAAEARRKLRRRHRTAFRTNLKRVSSELPPFLREVEDYVDSLEISDARQLLDAQQRLEDMRGRIPDFALPGKPRDLGRLEDTYAEYRRRYRAVGEAVASLHEQVAQALEDIEPRNAEKLLTDQLSRHDRQLRARLSAWSGSVEDLLKSEYQRFRAQSQARLKEFQLEAASLLRRLASRDIRYADASRALTALKEEKERESHDIYIPYIAALESLQDSIDIEHLATFGMEEVGEMQAELERLHSLAQLGIAVEILGHDLQAYDDILAAGLRALPDDVRSGKAGKDIEFAYEGLTDQLRFLSPLRLAGQKIQRWISGGETADYVAGFFGPTLAANKISFDATHDFRRLRVFDQQSRLFPVFINLLNNSIYWLASGDRIDRKVVFDAHGTDAIVSDNGPGVDPDDVERLFSLFFTRKMRGGRGIGLYLCRHNLAAGGHAIRYEPDVETMPLPGANFVITFRGAEFNAD